MRNLSQGKDLQDASKTERLGRSVPKHPPHRAHAHFKHGLGDVALSWPGGSQKSSPSGLMVHLKNENLGEIFNSKVQFYFTLYSIMQHAA